VPPKIIEQRRHFPAEMGVVGADVARRTRLRRRTSNRHALREMLQGSLGYGRSRSHDGMSMEKIETGLWGWAIIWLTLAYIVGLILLKEASGMEWLLALSAAKR
jgi:hypothetical protein